MYFTSLSGFIDRTFILVNFLFVLNIKYLFPCLQRDWVTHECFLGHSFDVDDGHLRMKLLQFRLLESPQTCVPASSLNESSTRHSMQSLL